jgi:hypothetical protein
VSRGLLAIRSHVDICDDRLLAVDALLDVKHRVAPYIDLQLVAFPQDGYYRSPSAVKNLERALDKGIDGVGGIPHFECTMYSISPKPQIWLSLEPGIFAVPPHSIIQLRVRARTSEYAQILCGLNQLQSQGT